MGDQWYLARGKQKYGPYPTEQLRKLAAAGQLVPTDMLLKDGTQKWLAAGTVAGLFPSKPAAPLPPPPPPAPARRPSPPVLAPVEIEEAPPPRRGRDDRSPPARQSRMVLWLLLGGGGVLLLCCGVPGLLIALIGFGHKAEQEEQNRKVAESKDAIKVSATELFRAYRDNEVSANNKYKGKVVEVTGTIVAVKERYIELNEDDSAFLLGLVHVTLEGKSKEKMANLSTSHGGPSGARRG